MQNVDRMEAVAACVARLVQLHGIEGVTHTRVARAAGVSRPWLYKYIGRERAALIQFMTRHFGMRLAEFDNRPRTDSREHWTEDTVEGIEIMVRQAAEAPWVLPLYFRYVGSPNPIGECIAELEARYLETCTEEVARAFGVSSGRARFCVELVQAARLGIVYRTQTAGFSSDPELHQLSAQLRRWLDTL